MMLKTVGNSCAVCAAILVTSCFGVSSAAIVEGLVTGGTSGGSFQLISPPAAIGPDSLESPDVFAFDELQDVVLTESLQIGPNRVAGPGSVISSHYIAFDPAAGATVAAYIEFDDRISAIIRSSTLDTTTDLIGIDSTTYTYVPEINTENTDVLMVDPNNPNRLNIRLAANSPGDHFRIFTGRIEPEPVPEPTSILLLAATTISLAFRQRRVFGS